MAKETFYFSHDYGARYDPKMQELLMGLGCEGIGIYWCMIEQLYEQEGILPLSTLKTIAFALHTDLKKIESVLRDYGLFKENDESFWSESVLARIKKRNNLIGLRKQAAETRWQKEKEKQQPDASECTCIDLHKQKKDLHMQCNAIKVNKSKVNNIKLNTEEDKLKLIEEEKNWKNDFEIYKKELREAYLSITRDKDFIHKQEKFYPNMDIKLSLEKACTNYWATEEGWLKKKRAKSEKINWKSTFVNALSINCNKVFK